MPKTKKELIQELLELEDNTTDNLGNMSEHKDDKQIEKTEMINDKENDEPITKPKRQLTEKQKEALAKGKQIRDANALKRKEERIKKEEEEKKIIEEKLVKKAIALKKKQIKKQALLDEISDDDTPIQKVKEIVEKIPDKKIIIKEPEKPKGPIIRFV